VRRTSTEEESNSFPSHKKKWIPWRINAPNSPLHSLSFDSSFLQVRVLRDRPPGAIFPFVFYACNIDVHVEDVMPVAPPSVSASPLGPFCVKNREEASKGVSFCQGTFFLCPRNDFVRFLVPLSPGVPRRSFGLCERKDFFSLRGLLLFLTFLPHFFSILAGMSPSYVGF